MSCLHPNLKHALHPKAQFSLPIPCLCFLSQAFSWILFQGVQLCGIRIIVATRRCKGNAVCSSSGTGQYSTSLACKFQDNPLQSSISKTTIALVLECFSSSGRDVKIEFRRARIPCINVVKPLITNQFPNKIVSATTIILLL